MDDGGDAAHEPSEAGPVVEHPCGNGGLAVRCRQAEHLTHDGVQGHPERVALVDCVQAFAHRTRAEQVVDERVCVGREGDVGGIQRVGSTADG